MTQWPAWAAACPALCPPQPPASAPARRALSAPRQPSAAALAAMPASSAVTCPGKLSGPLCVAGLACHPYFVIDATAACGVAAHHDLTIMPAQASGWVSGLRLAVLRVSGLHVCCRAHSAAGEVPGAPSSSSEAQGWHFSGRASNLSLVLWYPDEAPGCSVQVLFRSANCA